MDDENDNVTSGLEGLSSAALIARHAAHSARITEINGLGSDATLADVRERRTLTSEANEIAALVGEFTADTGELVTLPQTATPVAVPPTIVVGTEQGIADAIAAAANLAMATNTSGPAASIGVLNATAAARTVHGYAPGTVGIVRAGAPLSIGDIVTNLGHIANDHGRQGSNVPLVTLGYENEAEPVLRASASAAHNTAALAEFISKQDEIERRAAAGDMDAITAAGNSFVACGPADLIRDVCQEDSEARHLPRLFRNITAEHGELEYYRGFGLADLLSSVTEWDEVNQAGIVDDDSSTWKPCPEIGCIPTVKCGVEEIVQCITMRAFDLLTSKEAVGSMMAAARAALARKADGQMLRMYDTTASKYTFDAAGASTPFGAAVDIYDMLGRILGMSAAANRKLDLSGYTLLVEPGFFETLELDVYAAGEDGAGVPTRWSNLGISNTAITPDWSNAVAGGPWASMLPINPATAAPIPVPERPQDFTVRLFRKSDYAYLSPGGESLGIVPDLANKRRNKVTWFGAQYQGVCKLGCSPSFTFQVTNLCPTGARGIRVAGACA